MNIRIGPWRLTIEIVRNQEHEDDLKTVYAPIITYSDIPDLNGNIFPEDVVLHLHDETTRWEGTCNACMLGICERGKREGVIHT